MFHPGQKGFDPLQLQCRTKETRKQFPVADQFRNHSEVKSSLLEIGLHQFFPAHGYLLQKGVTERLISSLIQTVDRPGHIDAGRGQFPADLLQYVRRIGPRLIHFIDKEKRRDLISLTEFPERPGMSLHTIRSADHQDRIIQHLKGSLCFRRKIHMSRRVHQCNLQIPTMQSGLFGKNRDSSLPLHLKGVQEGIPVVHPAEGAYRSRRI